MPSRLSNHLGQSAHPLERDANRQDYESRHLWVLQTLQNYCKPLMCVAADACYCPRSFATEEELSRKAEIFHQRLLTSHVRAKRLLDCGYC